MLLVQATANGASSTADEKESQTCSAAGIRAVYSTTFLFVADITADVGY